MSDRACKFCRWFSGSAAKGGDCRRNPPTMVLLPEKGLAGLEMRPSSAFPPVTPETFCGEFADAIDLSGLPAGRVLTHGQRSN